MPQQYYNRKGGFSEMNLVIVIALLMVVLVAGAAIYAVKNPSAGSGSQAGQSTATDTLKVGDQAPAFSLPSTAGSTVSLSAYRGKPVFLYFNEGVACQPCWQQIISLEQSREFMTSGVPLVTIVPDPASSWRPILSSNRIQSPILPDTDLSVSRAYGMLNMGSSMHRGVRPGHTFMLLDKDGKVAWVGDYPSMSATASDLLTAVREKATVTAAPATTN